MVDRRLARAMFALIFTGFFGTILIIIWSLDIGNPLPILVELILVGGTVGLALWRRRADQRSRSKP